MACCGGVGSQHDTIDPPSRKRILLALVLTSLLGAPTGCRRPDNPTTSPPASAAKVSQPAPRATPVSRPSLKTEQTEQKQTTEKAESNEGGDDEYPDKHPTDNEPFPDNLEQETVNGIAMSDRAENVIKRLGKPDRRSSEALWGADGEYHQSWSFLELDLVLDLSAKKKAGRQTVRSIQVGPRSSLRTGRGIGIGSSPDEVTVSYSRWKKYFVWNRKKDRLVIGSAYGGIDISFKDNKVSGIFIGAGAE